MRIDLFGDEISYDPLENAEIFEKHIADILKPHFNEIKEQKFIDLPKPNGKRHKPDIIIADTNTIVSVKLQKTGGTAEEKLDYEMRILQRACDLGGFNQAFIVCGGNAWTFMEDLIEHSKNFSKVNVLKYENDKELNEIRLYNK
tara:strand:+ start:474 stop:905 length:432 start_codon:yes stop_codon:yes gene_type:complete